MFILRKVDAILFKAGYRFDVNFNPLKNPDYFHFTNPDENYVHKEENN